MSCYRRAPTGLTFFFTLVAFRRRPIFCDEAIRTALRDAIQQVRKARPCEIDAWVLLPDHMHCIWTLPEDDHDYSTRWSQIKHHVSYACGSEYGARLTRSGKKRGEAAIWQRRFWEHRIRSDYIHYTPVRHGHVVEAGAWPYSTFARYVRDGVYPIDWGGAPHLDNLDFE